MLAHADAKHPQGVDQDETAERKPRGRPKTDASRLHVSLPDELVDKLEKIRAETFATSVTEVIKNALIVYAALLDEHKRGRYVFTRSENGEDLYRMSIFL